MRLYYIVNGLLWIVLLCCILLTMSGCGSYMVVSTGSFVTTGKSMSDHVTSTVTGNDCNVTKVVITQTDYYCEQPREPGTTYNRSSF